MKQEILRLLYFVILFGLGGALIMAQRYFESATVYAYLLVMLICGYLFDVELLRLRRKVLHWYEG